MTRLIVTLFAIFCLACVSVTAEAAPSYRSALSAAKKVRKAERDLAKKVRGLSITDRARLKRATSTSYYGDDSDGDGVRDTYERARGSNVCDADSDDDGINDDDDGYENDDDKQGEVEVRGTVTSFEDPTLIVAGRTFTITGATSFRRGISSKSQLTSGLCIKVEGYVDASNVNIARKIEGSSRCSGGGSDD